MNEKVCPLLLACPADIPPECKGDRCAWYVPPVTTRQEGRCAVQALGALPDLIQAVKTL